MIPDETKNLILETARIEEVVGDFVTLKRRGASLVACCPFHNEKTPSFYVTPSKGIYKCFGCGKAGTAVSFVMEYDHVDYPTALKYLAKKYHIDVVEEELSAEEIAQRQRRESLLLVSEFALKYFASALSTPEGRAVGLAYLHQRGIEDETISRYGLGWAPSGRDSLVQAALKAGYKAEYLVAAGLAVQHEDGTVVDRFRERVMFPIHSVSGRVIAFSGRTLRSDVPAKYVNSPETEIYTKSKALLGIYFAKTEIARQDKCILVEGNVDVITMHQLGITNVVASCGTSLTIEQIRLISRFTGNMTIMYDGDKAGIKAAVRGIDLVLAEGMNVRVVLLPPGEDPDSFGRSHTRAEVEDYIAAHEKDFISFMTELLLADAAGDPLKKAGLINDVADMIAKIPDAVKRSVYVEATASEFAIDQQILFDRILKMRRDAASRSSSMSQSEPQSEIPDRPRPVFECETLAPLEADLLCFLLRYGEMRMNFETDSPFYSEEPETVAAFIRAALEEDGSKMVNSAYRKTYEAFVSALDGGMDQDAILRRLLDHEDPDIRATVSELALEKYEITVKNFKASMMTVESWLVTYVPKAIVMYAERRLEVEVNRLRKELSETESADDQLKLMQLIVRYQKIQNDLKKRINS